MNARENALRILRHGKGEWLPNGLDVVKHLRCPVYERPMTKTAKDAFGVSWVYSGIPGFGCHYDAKQEPVVADLEQWREQLTLPDLNVVNWERIERLYTDGPDENTVWDAPILMGPLERFTVLMPFEEALMNLLAEPGLAGEILMRITDYKVALIDRIADTMHPDSITLHDDWGMESGPFLSLPLWRALIKPCVRRMYDAVKRHGIILIQHSCGNVQPFLGDVVEMGADGWESYQSCNDLPAIKRAYGNRLVFVGAPDVRSFAARGEMDDEEMERELLTRLEPLCACGGYLPDSDIGSNPRCAAAVRKTIAKLARCVE